MNVIRCLAFLFGSGRADPCPSSPGSTYRILKGNKFPASPHIRRLLLSVAERCPPVVADRACRQRAYNQVKRRHPTKASHPQSHRIVCDALHALGTSDSLWLRFRQAEHLHYCQISEGHQCLLNRVARVTTLVYKTSPSDTIHLSITYLLIFKVSLSILFFKTLLAIFYEVSACWPQSAGVLRKAELGKAGDKSLLSLSR